MAPRGSFAAAFVPGFGDGFPDFAPPLRADDLRAMRAFLSNRLSNRLSGRDSA
jgi:hypothetical protein